MSSKLPSGQNKFPSVTDPSGPPSRSTTPAVPSSRTTAHDTRFSATIKRALPSSLPKGEPRTGRTLVGDWPPPPPSSRLPSLPPNRLPPPPARKPSALPWEGSAVPSELASDLSSAETVRPAAIPVESITARADPWSESIAIEEEALEALPDLEETKDSWEPPAIVDRSRTLMSLAGGGLCILAGLAVTVVSIVHAGKPSRTTSATERNRTSEPSMSAIASAAMLAPRPSNNLADQQKGVEEESVQQPTDSPKTLAGAETPADVPEVPLLDGSGSKAPTCHELLAGASRPAKLDPNAVYEQIRIGHRELVRGNVDASQAALCKASLWDPKNTQSLFDLTQLLLIRRDGTAAAEVAQRTVDLDPGRAGAQELLGDALARVGKLERARQAWLAAAHISEADTAALDTLVQLELLEAQRSLKKRDYRRAERFFRRVVSFKPAHAMANAGLAAALLKLGDSHAADIWSRRAGRLAGR